MLDNSINFYDVCEAADQYFEINDKNIKGSGWKQYQRWKNANEYKYYPTGERSNVDPYFSANTYNEFLQFNNSNSNLASNTWDELGPLTIDSITGQYSVGLGRIVALYVDPQNTNKLYIGSRSGGFWKTVDGGATWQGGKTDFLIASGVTSITASPTNSDSVLINLSNPKNGYSHGIYRSGDGGDNWNPSNFNPSNIGHGGLGDNFTIFKVVYHPFVPDLIFIGTSEGLYRSEDNLQTWTNLLNSPGRITDIAFHPTNPDIVYLYDDYYWGTNQNVVLRSIDMGLSFSPSDTISGNNNARGYLSVSADCPSCLYFASTNGIWKSIDDGLTFTFLNNPPQSCFGFAVNDLDTSAMIYGYVDIEASLDGGQTFNQITWWSLGHSMHGSGTYMDKLHNSGHYVHADLHPAICLNGVFYIGTDGFFCKSSDNGATWDILSNGTGVRENYKLGVSQSNHYRSISGSQDNGTSIKHKDTWIEFYGADGMEAIIHPLNDDWMIASWQNGGRRRTKDGGISGNWVFDQDGAWEAPILYNPNNQMKVYDFSDSIYVSDDFGSNWAYLGKPSTFSSNIKHTAIAENNSNIMLISSNSVVEKSIDGGINFSDITNNLPNSYITDMAFHPNNDDVIIVTYATWQNNGNKVFMTIDGGNSWSNITYNLVDLPIHSVVVDHTDSANIYLGGEMGVYTKTMNGNNWALYNPALPNATIEELEIVYGSNTIKAATWGRGLWEYDLIGRSNFPSILTTRITDMPTDSLPKENIDQYVTSIISYNNILNSVYVEWFADTNLNTNIIPMTNIQDSTWVTQNSIPNYPAGTKIYFKVFAVGNNNDTSETYRFMYIVQPCFLIQPLSITTSDVSCYGGNDGTAVVSISGGNSGYSFVWNTTPVQTLATASALTAGTYVCTITDPNNCATTHLGTITQPTTIAISSTTTHVSCYGLNDGSVDLTVSGGMPFTTDSLLVSLIGGTSQSGNAFNLINTSSGDLTITGFSQGPGSGNSANAAAPMEVYSTPGSYLTATSWILEGSATVVLTPGAATGLCPVNVVIPMGDTMGFWVGISVGTVQYTIGTGTPGVSAWTSDTNLTVTEGHGGYYPNGTHFSPRIWNGEVHYSDPNASPYTFSWSNGDSTEDISTLNTGTFSCIIYDFNGCSASSSFVVNQPNGILTVNISQNSSTLLASILGGTPPYSFQWNTNTVTQNITPLTNGIYWCLGTDAYGCISDTAFFNVTWISTDINELDIVDISIYPNPSDDVFNITFKVEQKQNIRVRILNVIGENLIDDDLQQFIGEYIKEIDLTGKSKGIYFLEIETEDGIINKKLILQ